VGEKRKDGKTKEERKLTQDERLGCFYELKRKGIRGKGMGNVI
jgi:hypothetical protein